MANLIEQMNVLKGLTDEHLQSELKAPSGSAPPYLVASELGRRKDMRQRYELEAARKKPQTTVMDDLSGMPPSTESAMPPMGGMGDMAGGIAPMPQRGFASGGIVDIAAKYQEKLGGLGAEKDRARAMALLAASGAILGGNHSNTLQNLGLGIDAGVKSYSTGLDTIDTEEMELLRGIADIGSAQHRDALSERDAERADRALAQDQTQFEQRLATDKKPAGVIEEEYRKTLSPEERADYDRRHPAYNPNSLTNDLRIADKVTAIYDDAQKRFPIKEYDTPEDASAKQTKARLEAYVAIKAAYGAAVADDWAAGMGLSPNDLLGASGGAAPVVDNKDPFGLGL